MKLIKISAAVLSAGMLFGAASVQAGVTGGVAFTSDYLFRGVSQTDNQAAVQGTLSYAHDSGFYATAWGSSVGFTNTGSEIDTLLGYSGKAGEVAYDVGAMRYNYPGANDPLAYEEVYGSVSFMGAKLGLNYSPDYFNESDKFLYTYVSYGKEVAGVGLFASVGLNQFDDEAAMVKALATAGTEDSYIDYKVAVSKTFEGVAFELAYMGSDIDDTECGVNICEGRAVLTASKSF